MQTRTYLSDNLTPHLAGHDGWEERWIGAFASHAERRFETRALVKVALGADEPATLAYIYALNGGGLVLVLAGADGGAQEPGNHEGHNEEGELDSTARAQEELWSARRGTGQLEIWISAPDQAVFHVERAEEGMLSTGFGRLGLSRTPDLILPRSTVTPPRKSHHEHF